MKIIRSHGQDYLVCERIEEFDSLYEGMTPCSYWEAQSGDIVRSDNGFYVPLLEKKQYIVDHLRERGKVTPRKTPREKWKFTFPLQTFWAWTPPQGKQWRAFLYSPGGAERSIYENTKAVLTHKKIFFANLLSQHVPVLDAIKTACPELTRSQQYHKRAMEFLLCPQTNHYLFNELGYMNSLKQELSKQGVTLETLGQEIASIINDKDESPAMRKFALETALKALQSSENENTNQTVSEVQSIKERLLKHVKTNSAVVLSLNHNDSQSTGAFASSSS